MKKLYKNVFKAAVGWMLILPVVLSLCGCPYSSPYKLDAAPQVLIDTTLVGKWATMILNGAGSSQPIKLIVEKSDDYNYDLMFTGNIKGLRNYHVADNDTIRGTAFITDAASRRFLNVQVRGEFYLVEFFYKNNKLNLLPLCEHFTEKMIRSDAELRLALEMHYHTRAYALYDDEFSLKGMSRVR